MRVLSVIVLLGACLAGSVASAQSPASPADLAKTISPFVSSETVAILHADLSRLDFPAIFQTLRQDLPAQDRSRLDPVLTRAQAVATGWLRRFGDAGGRDVFMLLEPGDLLYRHNPGYLIVPLAAGAKANVLAAMLIGDGKPVESLPARREEWPYVVDTLNGVLFLGLPDRLAALRAHPGSPRPGLAEAFAAAGDSLGQVVVPAPSADTRKVLEEMLPTTLPAPLSGEPVTLLTRRTHWISAGISLPPKMALHAIVQTSDPQAARAWGRVVNSTFELLRQTNRSGPGGFPQLDELLKMLTPRVQGDQLRLDLNADQANKLIRDAALPHIFGLSPGAAGGAKAPTPAPSERQAKAP